MDLGHHLGPHAPFIVASYAVALVVIVGLIVWVRQDYRAQRRRLVQLEQGGVTRRSQRAASRRPGVASQEAP
jgi:heme exporter protein D